MKILDWIRIAKIFDPFNTERGFLVCNDNQTHMKVRDWWEKLKNYEPNFFSTGKDTNCGSNSDTSVNIRFVAKTSDIRNFSQNIRSAVETSDIETWQHWSRTVRPDTILEVAISYWSEMSGRRNFSVRVQSCSDKIESDPFLIRKIFENHQSDAVLIRQCKILYFYFGS